MGSAETSYEALTTSDRGGEVLGRAVPRRRVWHPEQKMAIVQESLGSATTPTEVARRYGISTGLLYTWRKQLLTAATEGFMPCQVIDAAPAAPPALPLPDPLPAPSKRAGASAALVETGTIEVELASGARLRVTGAADAAVLRLVLDALR